MKSSFTNIYDKNIWGGGSGTGSNISRITRKYIEDLQNLIQEYEIKKICDIGCGDWAFSKLIDFQGSKYMGLDCVESVISSNIEKYKSEDISFECQEIGEEYIPKGYDLIIIKDVIQHWTDSQIMTYLEPIILNNKYVYCVNGYKFMRDPSKNSLEKRNIDNRYMYHPVDIEKYPLNQYEKYVRSKKEYHAKQYILFTSNTDREI